MRTTRGEPRFKIGTQGADTCGERPFIVEVAEMLPHALSNLPLASQLKEWMAQMARLDPDLAVPAALPLLIARLGGTSGVESPQGEACEDDEAALNG